jgi:hypothetical protein
MFEALQAPMHILVMATAEAQYEVQNFELHKSKAEQKSSYEKYQKRNKPHYSFSFKCINSFRAIVS